MMIFDTRTMSEWDHGLFQSSASHHDACYSPKAEFGAAGVCFQISGGISSLTVNSAHNQAGSQMNSSILGPLPAQTSAVVSRDRSDHCSSEPGNLGPHAKS